MNALEAKNLSSRKYKEFSSDERLVDTEKWIRAGIEFAAYKGQFHYDHTNFHDSLFNLKVVAELLRDEGFEVKVEQHYVCSSIYVSWE